MIKWELNQYTNDNISFSAYLPLARLHLKRSFNFEDDVVYVTTWIHNASNRFIDFFETKHDQNTDFNQNAEYNDPASNSYTMNEMKDTISEEKNIGSSQQNTLNFTASSFMNLPGNKEERKKAKAQRDAADLQRTYEVTRSFMEDEYRTQILESKTGQIKDFITSPRKFLAKYKSKSASYYDQVENDPNYNAKLNDKLIENMYNKKHDTWIEAKDEDLELKFEQDDRTRYDVEWCEHITISDPFLNDAQFILPKHVMDKNIAYNCPLEMPNSRFNGQSQVSLNQCLEIPKENEKDKSITEATACYVDIECRNNKQINETSFIVRNEKLGFELEYEWNSKTWPWLCIWTEHYGTDNVPWNGNERCRGLELSTKPFPIPSLQNELPKEEITKWENDNKVNCWKDKPIDFVLPHQGRAETFALRWSKIKN